MVNATLAAPETGATTKKRIVVADELGYCWGVRRALDIIENVLGSCVSPEVQDAVGRAESRQQALALLFMSAEFQRR